MSKKYEDNNIAFAEFIKQNRDKIIRNTPYNPSIKKNDEWLEEPGWDDYKEDLREG